MSFFLYFVCIVSFFAGAFVAQKKSKPKIKAALYSFQLTLFASMAAVICSLGLGMGIVNIMGIRNVPCDIVVEEKPLLPVADNIYVVTVCNSKQALKCIYYADSDYYSISDYKTSSFFYTDLMEPTVRNESFYFSNKFLRWISPFKIRSYTVFYIPQSTTYYTF